MLAVARRVRVPGVQERGRRGEKAATMTPPTRLTDRNSQLWTARSRLHRYQVERKDGEPGPVLLAVFCASALWLLLPDLTPRIVSTESVTSFE